MLNADAFFFFLFVDGMLIESMTTEYTDMEGWLSVTLSFWPLDPWVQLRFSFLTLKWRWSNDPIIFPEQADVLFSPLFPTSSPSLPFIWPSTPIGLDFMLTLRAPGCYLLTVTGFKIRVPLTKMDIELRCLFLGPLQSTAETISGLW